MQNAKRIDWKGKAKGDMEVEIRTALHPRFKILTGLQQKSSIIKTRHIESNFATCSVIAKHKIGLARTEIGSDICPLFNFFR